jgi:hypothetical protein
MIFILPKNSIGAAIPGAAAVKCHLFTIPRIRYFFKFYCSFLKKSGQIQFTRQDTVFGALKNIKTFFFLSCARSWRTM